MPSSGLLSICTQVAHLHTCTYTHTPSHIHTHIHTHIHIHTIHKYSTHTLTHKHALSHSHIHIHTYSHIYIHTFTYVHTIDTCTHSNTHRKILKIFSKMSQDGFMRCATAYLTLGLTFEV